MERHETKRDQQAKDPLDALLLPETHSPAPDTTSDLEESIESLAEHIAEIHKPVLSVLQGILDRLHETGNLGSYEANVRVAAKKIYRLAKACNAQLVYQASPVALDCVKRQDIKAGLFRLRTLTAKPDTVYQRKNSPRLEVSAASEPGSVE